jgi:hypothetical protein
MDPLWMAMSKLRRSKLNECIKICDEILMENPGDQVEALAESFLSECVTHPVYRLRGW